MSAGSRALERSRLEAKDRDSLQQIAVALGGEPPPRATKAHIVDMILELVGLTPGAEASELDARGINAVTANRPLDPPDDAARVLRIIADSEPDALHDPVRLAAFLADLMPHNQLQCRVLCAFVEHGQVEVIESATTSEQMSIAQAADNLVYETGLQSHVAAWAVDTWFCFRHDSLPRRDGSSEQPVVTARQAPTPWVGTRLIKMSEERRLFEVVFHEDGQATECEIFNPAELWPVAWTTDGPLLSVTVAQYQLRLAPSSYAGLLRGSETVSDRPGRSRQFAAAIMVPAEANRIAPGSRALKLRDTGEAIVVEFLHDHPAHSGTFREWDMFGDGSTRVGEWQRRDTISVVLEIDGYRAQLKWIDSAKLWLGLETGPGRDEDDHATYLIMF